MHHAMAIRASPAGNILTERAGGWTGYPALYACGISSNGAFTDVRAVMALLAQKWRDRLEQRRNVGAVRGMAIVAVLGHRLMFPQKRPAFFGMAGITGFGDRIFVQQFRTSRTMRVMAVGTGRLALRNRVMGKFERLRALLFMAGKADLGLSPFIAHLVMRRMCLVA